MADIKKYEKIAYISLTDGERAMISQFVDNMAGNFNDLAKIDTEGVEPLVTVLDIKAQLREDTCVQQVKRDELLSAAPSVYDWYYQVPKTV